MPVLMVTHLFHRMSRNFSTGKQLKHDYMLREINKVGSYRWHERLPASLQHVVDLANVGHIPLIPANTQAFAGFCPADESVSKAFPVLATGNWWVVVFIQPKFRNTRTHMSYPSTLVEYKTQRCLHCSNRAYMAMIYIC